YLGGPGGAHEVHLDCLRHRAWLSRGGNSACVCRGLPSRRSTIPSAVRRHRNLWRVRYCASRNSGTDDRLGSWLFERAECRIERQTALSRSQLPDLRTRSGLVDQLLYQSCIRLPAASSVCVAEGVHLARRTKVRLVLSRTGQRDCEAPHGAPS